MLVVVRRLLIFNRQRTLCRLVHEGAALIRIEIRVISLAELPELGVSPLILNSVG